MKTMKISLETAKSIYGKDESIDRILRETFTDKELGIKPKLPKTWEDVGLIRGFFINDNGDIERVPIVQSEWCSSWCIYPTEKLACAAKALARLLYLRDIYNDGWQPNWEDYNDKKYTIIYCADMLFPGTRKSSSTPMAFKTPELRDEFFDNFEELLEIAKPLL